MNIVTEIKEWQAIRKSLSGKTIGFIPTMGNLHAGHLSLCERSRKENELTVVSIFVNPTQFNQTSDYECYPRTLDQDKEYLSAFAVDYLFMPSGQMMYPDHYTIQIIETELSQELEGKYRPGHFTGMLTIVLKLLNLIQPACVYFGEKDYQQLLLVKKMVDALFLTTKVVACETVRAADGLALSSRNGRLDTEQRLKAAQFPKLLQSKSSLEKIHEQLIEQDFKVDYVSEKWQRRLAAVWLGDVRLIDNIDKG